MSDHVLFNNPAYGEEVASIVGVGLPPRSSSIVRVRFGHLMGGVIYYSKQGTTSISAHVGARTPYWLNRDMLFAIFDYPFRQLAMERIYVMVNARDEHAVRFNTNIGFRRVTVIPKYFKHGADCLVMCMECEDCRFLNVKPRSIKANIH